MTSARTSRGGRGYVNECWGCGQPAPGGVCAGPHPTEQWLPRAAFNMTGLPRRTPRITGTRQHSNAAQRRRRQTARVERAVERLAAALEAGTNQEYDGLLAMAREVLARRKVEA